MHPFEINALIEAEFNAKTNNDHKINLYYITHLDLWLIGAHEMPEINISLQINDICKLSYDETIKISHLLVDKFFESKGV